MPDLEDGIRPMKKLYVIDQSDFSNSPVGGSTTFLRTIVPELMRHFDVYLVGGSNNMLQVGVWSKDHVSGANFYGVGRIDQKNRFIPNRLRTLINFFRCRHEIIKNDPGVIMYFHQMELVLPFLKFKKNKKVLHIHGLANPLSVSRFKFLRKGCFRGLFDLIFETVESSLDLLLSVSLPNKDSSDEINVSRQDIFRFVPVCIDHNLFCPGDRRSCKTLIGLDPSIRTFGYVGRISKMKGLEDSLMLIKKYRDQDLDVSFIIVGDGENKASLVELCDELGIAGNVLFVSARQYQELPAYYNAIDIFLMSSKAEGFPMVVVEALACGTPVISTDVGAIRQIVSDGSNGFVIQDDFAAQAFVHAETIFAQYEAMSANARDSITPYRADTVVSGIASLLKEV